tara:strand:+ start:154 stop:1656 length:1503 start_codon:yes stop_codon:yes gene_type:complete
MAQDFMDILRIKKEDDTTIAPSETVEEKKRKKEQEAEEGKRVLEADKKRREANAKTVRMWKEILETFSRTGDVTDSDMRGTMREFLKSYLFPRSTSKQKIDDFYQSLLKQEAPEEILALFFKGYDTVEQDEEGLLSQFRQMSEDTAEYRQEEKKYNGKESLEIIREFFEAAADVPRNLLAGKKMTRGELNRLVNLLRETEKIDVDELGENPSTLLRQFRELVLTLDRLKEKQEETVSKSEPSQSRIPDFIRRKVEEEAEKKTKDIEDEDERKEAKEKMTKKLFMDYIDGKFPERTPESIEALRTTLENIGSAAQRRSKDDKEEREKRIQALRDVINSGESLLDKLKQKLSQTPIDEKTKIKSKIRETEKQIREAEVILEQQYKIKKPKEEKVQSTIDTKDTTWEYSPQDDEEDITAGFSYLSELEELGNFRNISKTISQIIDKIEEILQHVLDLRNRATEEKEVSMFEKTRKQMKQLVKVTVGNYEFDLGEGRKRAIKIN